MEEIEKRDWRELRFNSPGIDHDYRNIIDGKRQTALQRLAKRYKRFSDMALIFILMCIPLGMNGVLPAGATKWCLVVFYGVMMLVSSTMDRWLYIGISSIDVAAMPVSEVIRLATFYRKRHLQFVMILLPMAFIFIGGMIWLAIYNNATYYLGGMFAGAVIGFIIGLRELRKFMDDYREIKNKY